MTLLLQLQPLHIYIYICRTRTLTNLPFAICFCFKHFCFTSHMHLLTTSRGINFAYFTLPFSFHADLNPERTKTANSCVTKNLPISPKPQEQLKLKNNNFELIWYHLFILWKENTPTFSSCLRCLAVLTLQVVACIAYYLSGIASRFGGTN